MADLTAIREDIKQELQSYPHKEESEIKRQWKLMGLFGGHRSDLGHDFISTLMAITFGGFGIWWLLDRAKLSTLTQEWNADQTRRQNDGEVAKDIDGLVLADPVDLESQPAWADDPPGVLEKAVTLFMTFPVQMSLAIFKVMKGAMEKIPVIGPIYGFFLGLQEKFMEKAFTYMESVQIGIMTGMIAYMATRMGCIEVGLLMMGVSAVLAFTSVFARNPNSRWGRTALEWDYLLCSYYYHNRPAPFFVAYFKAAFMAWPRILGFGAKGESTLYNRLTGQASLICFLLIPVDLTVALLGSEPFSLTDQVFGTAQAVLMSIALLAMYAPAICGSLTRNKLLGETAQLKVAGTVGALGSAIGVAIGYVSGGF